MIFPILLAVLLLSNFGNCGVPGAFLIYGYKVYPEVYGTCYYAVCEKSTHGVTLDCFKKHTENGKIVSEPCGLELKPGTQNQFWKTDGNGKRTGQNAVIEQYGDVVIYHRTNKEGEVTEVICGTCSNKVTTEQAKIIEEKCKFKGVEAKKVDNSNC